MTKDHEKQPSENYFNYLSKFFDCKKRMCKLKDGLYSVWFNFKIKITSFKSLNLSRKPIREYLIY